jgi:hypothetical protein
VRTLKLPVTLPAEIEQVGVVTMGLVSIVQSPSARAKPVPVTDTDVPAGPEVGVRVTVCGIMYSVADAVNVDPRPVTVIKSVRPVNVTRTVNGQFIV